MLTDLISYKKDVYHYYSDEFKILAYSPKQIKNVDAYNMVIITISKWYRDMKKQLDEIMKDFHQLILKNRR